MATVTSPQPAPATVWIRRAASPACCSRRASPARKAALTVRSRRPIAPTPARQPDRGLMSRTAASISPHVYGRSWLQRYRYGTRQRRRRKDPALRRSARLPDGPEETGERRGRPGRSPSATTVAKALQGRCSVQVAVLMFKQTGTEFPLLAPIYVPRRLALMAFEATEKTIHEKVLNAINNPSRLFDFRQAALPGGRADRRCDRCHTAAGAHLQPEGRGPYITAGIVVSKSRERRSRHRKRPHAGPRPKRARRILHFETIALARTSPTPRRWDAAARCLVIGVDPLDDVCRPGTGV